jgi:streptogramin lyase
MGIAIDALGNVWFAEQNANYIGRFDPARKSRFVNQHFPCYDVDE